MLGVRGGALLAIALLAVATSLGACGASTSGSSYGHCNQSADCMVRSASCCGSCGAATRGDMIAINRKDWNAYEHDNCAGTSCFTCLQTQDPMLVAACVHHECEVLDVQGDASTACTSSADCQLRASSCCECGVQLGQENLIAVSDAARFSSLVCEGVLDCPSCSPAYPSDVTPQCSTDHHCEAVWP